MMLAIKPQRVEPTIAGMENVKPCCIWTADQRKYDIAPDSPWLKRLAFRAFCWIVEFCYEQWRFVPWDHRDAHGNYSWLERQGVFTERWRAAQEAAKYPHGFSLKLPLDEGLEANSVLVESVPSRQSGTAYERINNRVVQTPVREMARLRRKVNEVNRTLDAV